MKFDCTIYDMAEGTLHVTVGAADKNDAYEVAGIAASERGCDNVIEVVVGVFE